MKKGVFTFSMVALVFLFFYTSTHALEWDDGRIRIDYSVDVYYESVSGNVEKSSLDVDDDHKDAWHYNESLKMKLEQDIGDNLTLEFLSFVRNTTDKAVLDHRWYLLQMYLRLYNDTFEFAAGDINEFYSKYTIKDSFLGVKFWYKPSTKFKFLVLGGRNRDPKEDLFEHYFTGARLEYTPRANYLFGASYIHTEVTKLFSGSSVEDYSNDVWALDTRLKLLDRKLILKGEAAFSLYHEDHAEDLDGWALYLSANYRPIRDLKLSFDYERVEPDFVTILGTASPDREKAEFGVRYSPSRKWILSAKYFFMRDDLTSESDVDYCTYKYYSEFGVVVRPFYDTDGYFKQLKLDMKCMFTDLRSSDYPRSTDTNEYEAQFIISNRYKKMRYALEYRIAYTNDHTFEATDTLANTIGVKWSYNFDALGLDWKIKLGYKAELRDEYEQNPDRTIHSIAHTTEAGLGLFYEPSKTYLKLAYLGAFTDSEDGKRTERNTARVALEQVLYENNIFTSTMEVSYEYMNYWSTDHEDRYGEQIYMMSLSLQF
jgi:hypothetical protein